MNKDALMRAIKDNMNDEGQFSVYPGRRNVGDRSGKTTFRAPIVDLLLKDYKKGMSNIQSDFENARQRNDVRLKHMQLVPLRPSMTIPTEIIRTGSKEQNKFNMRLEHRVVKGITNLDIKLKKKRGGEEQNLRDFFDDQKYVTKERETKQIFYRTERTTFDRIFMIFEKSDRKAAETFLKTTHQRLRNVVLEESLLRIRGEEQDTRVGEINTYTDRNSIANYRELLEPFGNPQEEEANKYNKPVERNRRRAYIETFGVRDFPKIAQGNTWKGGKTVSRIKNKEITREPEKEKEPVVSQEKVPQEEKKSSSVESTLERFFRRMSKLEKDNDDQTETNDINLQALSDRTGNLLQKMQEDNKKTVENVTKQIEALTARILIRDWERA